jgi:hypothetical protein
LSFSLPPPPYTTTEVTNFVAALAMAGKGMKETKILTEQASSNKSLKRVQIYKISSLVKNEKSTSIQ